MIERLTGVVSLLEMLEFSAAKYIKIAHSLGTVIADLKQQIATGRNGDAIEMDSYTNEILEDVESLGLSVTNHQIGTMLLEMVKENPGKGSITNGVLRLPAASLDKKRLCYHLECIYSTLHAELGSAKLRVIPRERNKYVSEDWLTASPMFEKYPDTVDEFQRAGRCFAYGENTACVFHLMRVTDFYLRLVAKSLSIDYDSSNWHGVGDKISKNLGQKYQDKSEDWRKVEPFYAEVLTDIQAIGKGHRNPALHNIERKYEEREAQYLLTVIEGFARHVAEKL